MRIVFFGSSDFAVPSLARLIKGNYEILNVVTQPDREKGRHLSVEMTPIKQSATKHKLKILQPEKLNEAEFIKSLKNLGADIFIVVAYGEILSKAILDIPKIFSINLHGSLLPKYRGAAPINWAIINGEKKTGISIIKMNEFMDKGELILQKTINIDKDDTAISLSKKLATMGSEALIETLEMIKHRKISFIVQDEREACYASRLKKEDGLIDWKKDAQGISNQIRGLIPWPGSFTHYNNKLLKIWQAEVLESDTKGVIPGTIIDISKKSICVATGRGVLELKTLQPESGKRMQVAQFISGHAMKIGDRFG